MRKSNFILFLFFIGFFIGKPMVIAQDTLASVETYKRGSIRIKKVDVYPYYKLEDCKYTIVTRKRKAAKRSWLKKTVSVITKQEVDSSMLRIKEPVLGYRNNRYNRVDFYKYKWTDTPRVDTLKFIIQVSRGGYGRIKSVIASSGMSNSLKNAAYRTIYKQVARFSSGGGYTAKVGWRKKERTFKERFYCEIKMVVASFPLTKDQYEEDGERRDRRRGFSLNTN